MGSRLASKGAAYGLSLCGPLGASQGTLPLAASPGRSGPLGLLRKA
ncbi:MAG: hypothetical protein LBU69_00750 [Deltaproteobacteria bacterium]|nr:hypothetical protein [Deltaproteobacteria bacterium]